MMDWSEIESPGLDEFEAMARAAHAALPEAFRALAGNVAFVVQEFPDDDVARDLELESEFEVLGLFQGPDLADLEGGRAHADHTMIFLYRRPILDYWAEHHETLGSIVRHVLIHEIGHHFGLSDEDMDAIEERAG